MASKCTRTLLILSISRKVDGVKCNHQRKPSNALTHHVGLLGAIFVISYCIVLGNNLVSRRSYIIFFI